MQSGLRKYRISSDTASQELYALRNMLAPLKPGSTKDGYIFHLIDKIAGLLNMLPRIRGWGLDVAAGTGIAMPFFVEGIEKDGEDAE